MPARRVRSAPGAAGVGGPGLRGTAGAIRFAPGYGDGAVGVSRHNAVSSASRGLHTGKPGWENSAAREATEDQLVLGDVAARPMNALRHMCVWGGRRMAAIRQQTCLKLTSASHIRRT